jgi:hypothetical protein
MIDQASGSSLLWRGTPLLPCLRHVGGKCGGCPVTATGVRVRHEVNGVMTMFFEEGHSLMFRIRAFLSGCGPESRERRNMRKMLVLFVLAIASLWASPAVLGQEKRQTEVRQTPPQVFDGRLQIKVTGIEKVQTWKPLRNNPYSPTYAAKEGMDLVVVKFEVKKIQTEEPDWDQSFKGFELEDQSGKKYNSVILETNSREIGFGVPQGVSLKVFRMSGLSFDIEKMSVSKSQ